MSTRDHTASTRHIAAQAARRGFSLLEVVILMALVSIAAGIAMPRPRPQAFALRNAESMIVTDLRQTRAEAMTRGVHFRLEIIDTVTHRILRMREAAADVWVQDGVPVVVRTAPESTHMGAPVVGTAFEFNTRGVLVTPTVPVRITLHQDTTGLQRIVDVWPSGQVTRGGA